MMKAVRPSQEKTQDQVHRVRITLSSTNARNLEKVCAELVNGANKRLQVMEDGVMPEKTLPIANRVSREEGSYFPKLLSRRSKKGGTNFRWNPTMTRFLLPFLIEQAKLGHKYNKCFRRPAFIAAAEAVSEKFKLHCTDGNVENHLRTIRTRYQQIRRLQSLSNTTWDEKQKKILMDEKSYSAHIAAQPKDEPFLNKRIDMYDEMVIVCSEDDVIPENNQAYQVLNNVDNEDTKENVEVGLPLESMAGDEMNIVMDEAVEIEDVGEETPPLPSRSLEASTSGSTGRTGHSNKKRKSHHFGDKIDYLASQIGLLAEAIRSSHKCILSELYSEVMKCEGYDEISLGRAFDYLIEHENLARGFLVKNYNLRQAWLASFFSDAGQMV